MTLFNMPEVCRLLKQPYHRVYYATITNQVTPMKAGRSRLFTVEDVEILKKWFELRKKDD